MVGQQISTPFDEPFFAGASSTVDDQGLPVSINGRGFLVDLESQQFSRRSVQLLNTQQAQSGGDTSQVPPEVWRRSQDSWHFGAGQSRYDREESLPYRFHESDGVDPWEKFHLRLLHDTNVLRALGSGEQALLCSIGASLFVSIGADTFYYASTASAPVSHTSTGTVLSLVSDGENLYTLCADGKVEKRNAAGVWSTFYTVASFDPTRAMLAACKGFIIVGHKNVLLDITTGSATTIFTHPLTGWTWRDATSGLAAIYLLGGIGDRWHIHRMTVANTGATLDPPVVTASLPDGEVAYCIAAYLGFVLIGVHYGWRLGSTDGNGDVTYGPVVRTLGPVRCFEGQDRFVWFGLSKPPDTPGEGGFAPAHAGLGRCDLSTFTTPLTPAYAGDLAGAGDGTTRSVVTVTGGSGLGLRVFSVDGVGVFVEDPGVLREDGWVSFGAYNFNSSDRKMGLYLQVFHEELLGGRIGIDVANDLTGSVFSEVGYNDNAGSAATGNVPYPFPFNSAEIRLVLERDAIPEYGPEVTRTEFRGVNVPGRTTEWRIPLMLAEQIESQGAQINRSVEDDYDFLVGLTQTRQQFEYREGGRTWLLHATEFLWTHHHLTTDAGTYSGTFTLVAREMT